MQNTSQGFYGRFPREYLKFLSRPTGPIGTQLVEARAEVLGQALAAVTKDRNLDYGNPEDNFKTIAAFWEVYKHGYKFTATDVAVMMDLVKTSRIMTSPKKIDHWVDKAGYSACGYRCAIVAYDEDTGSGPGAHNGLGCS